MAASSDFAATGTIVEAEGFRFERVWGPGTELRVSVEVETRGDELLRAHCSVSRDGRVVSEGKLAIGLVPAKGLLDLEMTRGMWRELNGAA